MFLVEVEKLGEFSWILMVQFLITQLEENSITMNMHMVLMCLAGLMNREQHMVIDYLREENKILKEHLSGKRIRYTDKQRRRLALKAKALDRNPQSDSWLFSLAPLRLVDPIVFV